MVTFRKLITYAALPALISLPIICLAQPPIEIEPPNFEVIRGEVVEFQHEIFNRGEEALRIALDVEVIREPDDDHTPPALSVAPEEAEIAAGGRIEITFTIDAREADAWDYLFVLSMWTNNPDEGEVVEMGAITVLPRPPEIEFAWRDNEFEDVFDWNHAYQDLFVGGRYNLFGEVLNRGDEALQVEASSDNEVFTIEPANFDVDSGGAVEVTITLAAPEPGQYEGTLIFRSNDPDDPELVIAMIAEVLSPPNFPEPADIETWMVTGQIEEHVVTLENTGDALLRFVVELEIISEPERDNRDRSLRSVSGETAPGRDDRGDLLAQFNFPANQYKNCVYDPVNEWMWIVNYTTEMASAYTFDNYENVEEVVRINPGQCIDGASFNGLLYLPPWNNPNINRYNENGQNIGAVQLPFGILGLAIDAEEGWLFAYAADNFIHVFRLDDDGNIDGNEIGVIRNHMQYHSNINSYGLEWVGSQEEGQLWMVTPQNRLIHQITVDTENWQCVGEFEPFIAYPGQDQAVGAPAHDGQYIWTGGFSAASVRVYDDGIFDTRWISVEPTEGEIEPGDRLDLIVTLDATGLWGGEYVADLHILTNDPDDPERVVNVTMVVEAPWPMAWEWPEAAGYPDCVDFGMAYGSTFIGDSDTISMTFTNHGIDDFEFDEIFSDDEVFRIEPNQGFVVEPAEEVEFSVIFAPAEVGEVDGILTFVTNEPDWEAVEIPVRGVGIEAPEMHVDTDIIEARLAEGEVSRHEVTISNEGGSPLLYMIEVVSDQNERDGSARTLRQVTDGLAPQRDHPGDLIGDFNGNNRAGEYCSCVGWDWDNDWMWVSNYNARNIVAWSHDERYENFAEELRLDVGACMDGAWAKGLLYLPTWASATINRFNEHGQNVGAINMAFSICGMAADVENDWMFIQNPNDGLSIWVYNLNDNGTLGERIGRIPNHNQFHNNVAAYNLEWVPKHPQGQLWMTEYTSGRVNQIAVDTENWICTELVQNFRVFPQADQPYSAVAHDGYNLWAAGYAAADIRIYDDGIREAYWLTVEPEEGVIDPGGSQVVTVTIDCNDLLGGVFAGEVHIISNDPRNREHVIQIEMFLQDGGRALNWEPFDPDQPQAIEFQATEAGETSAIAFTATNVGGRDISIDEVVIEGDADVFSVEPVECVIQPRNSAEFTITFAPQEIGEYQATIIWLTNDEPFGSEVAVEVRGEGVISPQIAVSEEFIDVAADPDQENPEVFEFVLANQAGEGGAILNYAIDSHLDSIDEIMIPHRQIRSADRNAVPVRDRRGGPDDGGYEWRDSNDPYGPVYEWIDVSRRQGVSQLQGVDDINLGPRELDFDFPWYGREYRQIRICSNGWITFSNYDVGNINLPNLPNANEPNATIAPLNFDLNPGAGGSWYFYTNNNDMAVVQWQDVPEFGNNGNVNTFEVILYSSGMVKLQYARLDGLNPADPMVGYENENGQIGASIVDRGAGGLEVEYAIGIAPRELWSFPGLTISPEEGSIEAGQDTTITLTFDIANLESNVVYVGSLSIVSNDQDRSPLEIPLSLVIWNGPRPPDLDPSDANHSVLVTNVLFDGEQAPAGWEIGVFSPAGVLCGFEVWRGEALGIAVWGADDGHRDYFHAGERMSFRAWDPRADQEYQMVADIEEGGIVWQENGFTALSLAYDPGFDNAVQLRAGWNLMSLNVIPGIQMREDHRWVEDMFYQLRRPDGGHHVILLKDQDGRFWRPSHNYNNILYWNSRQGYQICVDEAVEAIWSGQAIDPQADIPLRRGWNIAPYYPDYPLDASSRSGFYVVSPILDYVILAKDDQGNFMYPRRGYSGMQPWHEGKGYQIKVSEAVTLNYPQEQEMLNADGDADGDAGAAGRRFKAVEATGRNMSVLIGAKCKERSAMWEIGAFTQAGLCVGSASFQIPNSKLQIGMAVWGDDPSTPEIDGALEGEALSFRLWDGTGETLVVPTWEQYDEQSCLSYSTDGFAAGEIRQTGISLLPERIALYPPTPNPFNNSTRITFALPEAKQVRLGMYDGNGRLSREVIEGEFSAGEHAIEVDGKNLAAGIYLFRLEAGDVILTEKAALVK